MYAPATQSGLWKIGIWMCRSWFGIVTVWLMFGILGCSVRFPADPERGGTITPDVLHEYAWPTRQPAVLEEWAKDAGIVMVRGTRPATVFPDPGRSRRLLQSDAPIVLPVCRGLYGQGVVFQESLVNEDQTPLYYRVLINDLGPEALRDALEREDPTGLEKERLGRWLFKLIPAATQTPRGLVIQQVSLNGERFENPITDLLHDRGWAVLRVYPGGFTFSLTRRARAGGDQPDDDEYAQDPEGLAVTARPVGADDDPETAEIKVNRRLDSTPPQQELVDPATLSLLFDRYAVDSAYALESMLAYLDDAMPEIVEGSVVLAGFSLGALTVPTVAARIQHQLDAVVMVGGGCNLGQVFLQGAVTYPLVKAVQKQLGEEGVRPLWSLPHEHLHVSRFDAYHTAPLLGDIPVLLLHAHFDEVIPSETGELLYRRLGRPERWTYPVGHLALFWWLPNEARSIANWIERTIRRE